MFGSQAHEIYDVLRAGLERHEFGCFSGEKPMSGFYSLLIGATMCDQITMYGFEPWEDWMAEANSELHYHYFDAEEPRPGAHSFDATFFMYRIVEMSKKVGLKIREIELPEKLVRLKERKASSRHAGPHAHTHAQAQARARARFEDEMDDEELAE